MGKKKTKILTLNSIFVSIVNNCIIYILTYYNLYNYLIESDIIIVIIIHEAEYITLNLK